MKIKNNTLEELKERLIIFKDRREELKKLKDKRKQKIYTKLINELKYKIKGLESLQKLSSKKGCGVQEYLEVKGIKLKTERCGYYPKNSNEVYYCEKCSPTKTTTEEKDV